MDMRALGHQTGYLSKEAALWSGLLGKKKTVPIEKPGGTTDTVKDPKTISDEIWAVKSDTTKPSPGLESGAMRTAADRFPGGDGVYSALLPSSPIGYDQPMTNWPFKPSQLRPAVAAEGYRLGNYEPTVQLTTDQLAAGEGAYTRRLHIPSAIEGSYNQRDRFVKGIHGEDYVKSVEDNRSRLSPEDAAWLESNQPIGPYKRSPGDSGKQDNRADGRNFSDGVPFRSYRLTDTDEASLAGHPMAGWTGVTMAPVPGQPAKISLRSVVPNPDGSYKMSEGVGLNGVGDPNSLAHEVAHAAVSRAPRTAVPGEHPLAAFDLRSPPPVGGAFDEMQKFIADKGGYGIGAELLPVLSGMKASLANNPAGGVTFQGIKAPAPVPVRPTWDGRDVKAFERGMAAGAEDYAKTPAQRLAESYRPILDGKLDEAAAVTEVDPQAAALGYGLHHIYPDLATSTPEDRRTLSGLLSRTLPYVVGGVGAPASIAAGSTERE